MLVPLIAALAAAGFQAATPYATAQRPVLLTVDASRAAEGIMEVRERIPARPGDFTVVSATRSVFKESSTINRATIGPATIS